MVTSTDMKFGKSLLPGLQLLFTGTIILFLKALYGAFNAHTAESFLRTLIEK